MARPIKETPVLKGRDALAFAREMKKSESKKADEKTRQRIAENFAKLSGIQKFS